MRILSVRFKNLNSLAGEWFIDFSHPEYLSNGLFAITGPTGSGKTTILDAVCLGLYGRTPRLEQSYQNNKRDNVATGRGMFCRGHVRDSERAVLMPVEPASCP